MNQSGRVRLGLILTVLVLVAAVYCGIQIGGVYFRKYQIKDAVERELTFVGQRTDAGIRENILAEIRAAGVPPEAQRFTFVRNAPARELQFSTAYTETVDLLVTKREIAVRLSVSRRF